MLKIILLVILLFLAYGYAVWLLKKLANTSQQIADLRSQLTKNDELLHAKVAALEEQKRQREAAEQGDASEKGQ